MPGPPRESRRRGRDLARRRARWPRLGRRRTGATSRTSSTAMPELGGRVRGRRAPPRRRAAPFQATSTPPSRSSGAAYSSSDVQRRQRPRRDDVAAPDAVGPLLRARVTTSRAFSSPVRGDAAVMNAHLRADALHERDARRRAARPPAASPGKPAPGAEVRDLVAPRGRRRGPSADERVRDVDVDGAVGLAHRRRRVGVGRERPAASQAWRRRGGRVARRLASDRARRGVSRETLEPGWRFT